MVSAVIMTSEERRFLRTEARLGKVDGKSGMGLPEWD
jgi:hypothetical protein